MIKKIKNKLLSLYARSKGYNTNYIIENYCNYGIKAVDKKVIDLKITKFKQASITKQKRDQELIVNLTSFPERMQDIHYTLYSLLTQSFLADRVILWLSYEEFPNKIQNLPKQILKFIDLGLEIEFYHNIKSYKKLIPSLKKYPNAIHVTADDDIFYPYNWLEDLYAEYQQYGSNYIYTNRAHKILLKDGQIYPYEDWEKESKNQATSFSNFPTGSGGVLYPSKVFNDEIFNENIFINLAPTADDIWYWSMAVLNGKKIKILPHFSGLVYVNPERELRLNGEYTLSSENVVEKKNDLQLKQVIDHYSILERLNEEFDSARYWESRYQSGRNSGAGSYGRLAEFKADVINTFIEKYNIHTVIEFGVGDGNQLGLYNIPTYLGFDVSDTILEVVRSKYSADMNKEFLHISFYQEQKADLVLSLDVIYHLIEDEIFEIYMNNLFSAASSFVIIYASNKEEYHCEHVLHRNFTFWIEKNAQDWKLQEFIKNKYPYDVNSPDDTSFADFYIFKRQIREK